MISACLDALLANIPEDEIDAIHLKGSAIREWDTPVDYVPELSDVDIHVLFADDDAVRRRLDPVEQGMRIRTNMEEGYYGAIPTPLHLPRVQLVVANDLYRQPDYTPSPPGTVRTLLGPPPAPAANDAYVLRDRARRQLLDVSPFAATLGRHIADMAGKHVWPLVRSMSWRVSPTGPRVLELLGTPHAHAWSRNRTAIIKGLEELAEHDLARDYAAFYLSGWEYFLSGYAEHDAAQRAVWFGARVLERGVAVAGRAQSEAVES